MASQTPTSSLALETGGGLVTFFVHHCIQATLFFHKRPQAYSMSGFQPGPCSRPKQRLTLGREVPPLGWQGFPGASEPGREDPPRQRPTKLFLSKMGQECSNRQFGDDAEAQKTVAAPADFIHQLLPTPTPASRMQLQGQAWGPAHWPWSNAWGGPPSQGQQASLQAERGWDPNHWEAFKESPGGGTEQGEMAL